MNCTHNILYLNDYSSMNDSTGLGSTMTPEPATSNVPNSFHTFNTDLEQTMNGTEHPGSINLESITADDNNSSLGPTDISPRVQDGMTFSVSSAVEVSAALDGKSSEQSNVCKVCRVIYSKV